MEFIFYGQLNSQSRGYGAGREVSDAVACVWRLDDTPLELAPMTARSVLLEYGSKNFKIWRTGKKFYCTFNHFQLVEFTFKFGLRIIHQNILMAFNFGVAIYIVGKQLSR